MSPMATAAAAANPRSSAGALTSLLPCDLWMTVRFAESAKRKKKNKAAWDTFETEILAKAFAEGNAGYGRESHQDLLSLSYSVRSN